MASKRNGLYIECYKNLRLEYVRIVLFLDHHVRRRGFCNFYRVVKEIYINYRLGKTFEFNFSEPQKPLSQNLQLHT